MEEGVGSGSGRRGAREEGASDKDLIEIIQSINQTLVVGKAETHANAPRDPGPDVPRASRPSQTRRVGTKFLKTHLSS